MTDFSVPLGELETYVSLLTLTAMEIVLGIDNVVFLSIICSRLPKEQQPRARSIGLGLAFVFRVALLLAISWIIGLTRPLFEIFSFVLTGRDLVLLLGGLFLIAKSTMEIHAKIEGEEHSQDKVGASSMWAVIVQIGLIDLVFSFDSVITAVGLVKHVPIMVAAVIISLALMLLFAGVISRIIEKHPTVKMLALSFLLMIGTMLVAEGLHFHIEKGYIYFAMAFSLFVELLNSRLRKPTSRHEA